MQALALCIANPYIVKHVGIVRLREGLKQVVNEPMD